MSLKQRRDHRPYPLMPFGGYGYNWDTPHICIKCGERMSLIQGREHHKDPRYRVENHWRHWRRS